jgi:hypothetical protein
VRAVTRLVGLAAAVPLVLCVVWSAGGAPAGHGQQPALTWRIGKTFGNDIPESIAAPAPRDAWLAGVERNSDVFVQHWNGRAWRAVPGPRAAFTDSGVTIAASSAKNAWLFTLVRPAVANSYTVAWRWNGRRWSRDTFRGVEIFAASVFSQTDAWAFGQVVGKDGNAAPYVVRFDGTRWRRVPAPFLPTGASGLSARDLWIVGRGRSPDTFMAAKWTTGRWHQLRLPNLRVPRGGSTEQPSIVALSPANVWVDGTVWTASVSTAEPLLLHYNGSIWARIRVPYRAMTEFRAMTPDGLGGIWIGADARNRRYGLLSDYRDGRWSSRAAPVSRGDYVALDSMATTPGSTTAWAVGYAGNSTGNATPFGVLFEFGR